MSRIVDRTGEYRDRREAHHGHPHATNSANAIARARLTTVHGTARHAFLRALAGTALDQLVPIESTSTERQALLRRLGGRNS